METQPRSLIAVYREALASRHYARRTIDTYERWLRRLLRFRQLGARCQLRRRPPT